MGQNPQRVKSDNTGKDNTVYLKHSSLKNDKQPFMGESKVPNKGKLNSFETHLPDSDRALPSLVFNKHTE